MAEDDCGFKLSQELVAKHVSRLTRSVARTIGRPLDESEALMVRAYAEVTCKFLTAIALKAAAAEIARLTEGEMEKQGDGEA